MGRRLGRAVSGALCAGLAVLAVALVGVWLVARAEGDPGPGASALVGHLMAAAVAVALQRVAERRADRVGSLAAAGVVLAVLLVGALYWWS
jgi:hypothetical protein